jgi:hypothetical protein
MAQEWNIKSRGHACLLCGAAFAAKQPCISALRESDAGYDRVDACAGCWKAGGRDWKPFSEWEGVYEKPPEAPKKEAVTKESAETLLRRLVTMGDPAMQNVIYVLAVMLERGKQLVERDAKPQADSTILRVYEHRASGDSFVVLDPRLRLDQIGDVQRQVVELLGGTGHL